MNNGIIRVTGQSKTGEKSLLGTLESEFGIRNVLIVVTKKVVVVLSLSKGGILIGRPGQVFSRSA